MNYPMNWYSVVKKSNIFVVILLSFCLFFGNLHAQDLPERPTPPKLVNDFANIIPDNQERILENKLVAYNDTTSTQILVVTMSSLEGYPISEFSYELGDKWGVGQAGKDNGLVITVAVEERKTFIATGWGVEGSITDVTAKKIVDNIMIPEFRQGDFYAGIDNATTTIIGLLSGNFESKEIDQADNDIPLMPIIIVILVIIFFIWVASKGDNGGQINRRGWSGPVIFPSGGGSFGGGGFGGGGGGGFGGFGGGSFGGGGAGGSW